MQRSANEINFTILRNDGSAFPALIYANEDQDDNGKPSRVRIALLPIADRKKYERELLLERKRAEMALRAKSDFVSLLTHEIRTPLNAIIGVSYLLADTNLGVEQRRYSKMLASSSEHLMSLLNSILDFSKVDAGKARVDERPFEFEKTIRTTALAFQASALRKAIDLVVDIPSDVPQFLCGDQVKIGQMVSNLIGNAIKFTQKGSVTLRVEMIENFREVVELRFSVVDTGIGIAEDIIPKIFEEYSQANYEAGTTYGGTGLGLAIVHRLAALHGSQIAVTSKVGKGSSFSFNLKFKIPSGEHSVGPSAVVIDDSLNGVRILVADDSEDNQEILAMQMKRWGVKVTTAKDGQEVLNKLISEDFDFPHRRHSVTATL